VFGAGVFEEAPIVLDRPGSLAGLLVERREVEVRGRVGGLDRQGAKQRLLRLFGPAAGLLDEGEVDGRVGVSRVLRQRFNRSQRPRDDKGRGEPTHAEERGALGRRDPPRLPVTERRKNSVRPRRPFHVLRRRTRAAILLQGIEELTHSINGESRLAGWRFGGSHGRGFRPSRTSHVARRTWHEHAARRTFVSRLHPARGT